MTLITDRTETDALMGTEKGTYQYTDLNRVEEAVKSIAGQFMTLGISEKLETKTDWEPPNNFSVSTWPVHSQMERYLNNIYIIQELFMIPMQLPVSMDKLTWAGANSIEKVLMQAHSRIEGIKQSYRYSGEIYAGEGNL